MIYVVDDDVSVLKALCRLLNAEGYPTASFSSGDAFIAQYDSEKVACVLLDVAMPGKTGLAVQNSLLRLGNCPPIIFLTGDSEAPGTIPSITNDAPAYVLAKPVDATVLLSTIEKALSK